MYEIIQEDILEWAKTYKGPPFHAILTDPPYHLTSITERFGKEDSAPAQFGTDGAFARASGGFMGKIWDGGDIAFRPETWKALAQHLYPGGFIIAFAGSRGWHREAVAMEDAELIMHPTIFGWQYNSGFPKSTRIDNQLDKTWNKSFDEIRDWLRQKVKEKGLKYKTIDKALGNENSHKASHYLDNSQPQLPTPEDWSILKQLLEINDVIDMPPKYIEFEREIIGQQTKARKSDCSTALPTTGNTEYKTWNVTAPASDEAKAWIGHRYGKQAMKPALEPILLFQKPYENRPIDDIAKTGAGALNIDLCRIGTNGGTERSCQSEFQNSGIPGEVHATRGYRVGHEIVEINSGRWPSNFVLVHTPDCVRVGTKKVKGPGWKPEDMAKASALGQGTGWNSHQNKQTETTVNIINEDGTETVDDWQCSENCPVKLLNEQSGILTSGAMKKPYTYKNNGFSLGQPTGETRQIHETDSGHASRFFLNADWHYEIEENLFNADPVKYCPKASTSEKEAGLIHELQCLSCKELDTEIHIIEKLEGNNQKVHSINEPNLPSIEEINANADNKEYKFRIGKCRRNSHPCIKPISLIEYLAKLLLPPKEYTPRRILVPFSGTSSEMIGAMLAGWEEIVGIEMEQEYCKIGEARLKYYASKPKEQKPIKIKEEIEDEEELEEEEPENKQKSLLDF